MWTAKPRLHEVCSQLSDLPNFMKVSLLHINNLLGKCYGLISGNYKDFPTRQDIYDIQTNLRWEEFVDTIYYLTDIIRNQQC